MEATNSVILEIDTNENAHTLPITPGEAMATVRYRATFTIFIIYSSNLRLVSKLLNCRCLFKVYHKHELDIYPNNPGFLKLNVHPFFNLTLLSSRYFDVPFPFHLYAIHLSLRFTNLKIGFYNRTCDNLTLLSSRYFLFHSFVRDVVTIHSIIKIGSA